MRLTAIDTSTAVSLGGYNGSPRLRLSDPAGLSLTISHEASSVPEGPLSNSTSGVNRARATSAPSHGWACKNSLVRRQGLVSLDAG